MYCSVDGCTRARWMHAGSTVDVTFGPGDGRVHMHRVPRRPRLRARWATFCQLAGGRLSAASMVCSRHFLAGDYARDLRRELLVDVDWPRRLQLLETAVPTQNGPTTLRQRQRASTRRPRLVLPPSGATSATQMDPEERARLVNEAIMEYNNREGIEEEPLLAIVEAKKTVGCKARSDAPKSTGRKFNRWKLLTTLSGTAECDGHRTRVSDDQQAEYPDAKVGTMDSPDVDGTIMHSPSDGLVTMWPFVQVVQQSPESAGVDPLSGELVVKEEPVDSEARPPSRPTKKLVVTITRSHADKPASDDSDGGSKPASEDSDGSSKSSSDDSQASRKLASYDWDDNHKPASDDSEGSLKLAYDDLGSARSPALCADEGPNSQGQPASKNVVVVHGNGVRVQLCEERPHVVRMVRFRRYTTQLPSWPPPTSPRQPPDDAEAIAAGAADCRPQQKSSGDDCNDDDDKDGEQMRRSRQELRSLQAQLAAKEAELRRWRDRLEREMAHLAGDWTGAAGTADAPAADEQWPLPPEPCWEPPPATSRQADGVVRRLRLENVQLRAAAVGATLRQRQSQLDLLETRLTEQVARGRRRRRMTALLTHTQLAALDGNRPEVWPEEDLSRAVELRAACGDTGYLYLSRQLQLPLPQLSQLPAADHPSAPHGSLPPV